MQIKRFEARDMAEALKMIKREFGPQAVILSARDITKGKGILGFMRSPGVEVTAATDTHHVNGKPKTETPASRKWTLRSEPFVERTHHVQSRAGASRFVSPGKRDPLKRDLPAKRENTQLRKNDNLISFLNLYEDLMKHGVEEGLASSVIERLREKTTDAKRVDDMRVRAYLKEVLAEMGVADRETAEKHRVAVFVGPTGVGKTTTIAKIAIAETFQNKKEIALITLNDHRIGASAQMEAYGNILSVPVAAVSSRKDLKDCLRRFREKDLILIDTPGISHHDVYGIDEIKALLHGIDSLEIHLLAAAGTRGRDFESIFEKFGMLPLDWLLFTKIDETLEFGSMLNAVVRTKLPISYFANGQEIPENIEEGSVDRLMELLCTGQKWQTREFSQSIGEIPRDCGSDRGPGFETKGYVANRNSDLFHHPSCKWVERIDRRNRVVFKTPAEALAKHFRPCMACQPAFGEEDVDPLLDGAGNEKMREIAY